MPREKDRITGGAPGAGRVATVRVAASGENTADCTGPPSGRSTDGERACEIWSWPLRETPTTAPLAGVGR